MYCFFKTEVKAPAFGILQKIILYFDLLNLIYFVSKYINSDFDRNFNRVQVNCYTY